MPWVPISINNPSEKDIDRYLNKLKGKARFLVDEQLATMGVTETLRKAGLHAKDVIEAGLMGRGDEKVFAYAKRENLILLTNDDRFFRDDDLFPLKGSPGVIIVPKENVEHLLYSLKWILKLERYPGVYREAKFRISKDGITSCKDLAGSSKLRKNGREIWVDEI